MNYRPQMQMTFGGRMTPMVKILITVNVVIFLLQLIFQKFLHYDVSLFFGLVPYFVTAKLFVWQLFTYMFLHGSLMHILFNMLVLWMLGSEVEEKVFWSVGFLKYYLVCGIGAAAVNVLFSYNSMVPIIGASGAIYGILVAYAVFFGNRQLILFPFPVLIRAKYFVLIIGGIELVSSIFYTTDGVAHIAHLAGMGVGYLYILYRIKGPPRWMGFFKKPSNKKPKFTIIDGGQH
jgi:membrane associated rhomboid family serine protease